MQEVRKRLPNAARLPTTPARCGGVWEPRSFPDERVPI